MANVMKAHLAMHYSGDFGMDGAKLVIQPRNALGQFMAPVRSGNTPNYFITSKHVTVHGVAFRARKGKVRK